MFFLGGECVCVHRGDCIGICLILILLCLELEAETKFVATSVNVLPIEESRERQLDACKNTSHETHHNEPAKEMYMNPYNLCYVIFKTVRNSILTTILKFQLLCSIRTVSHQHSTLYPIFLYVCLECLPY